MATVTKPRKKAAASHQTKMLIDGKFRDSVSGKTFATINPATEKEIAPFSSLRAERSIRP